MLQGGDRWGRGVTCPGAGEMEDKLDIYMESHEAALEWGVRDMEVYAIEAH